jgi:hypothetical protein
LKVRTDWEHAIEIKVPDMAAPGSTMVLTKLEQDGWQIGIANFPLPETIGREIPSDVTPGVTELPIMYKGVEVTKILVPDLAKPGVDDIQVVRPEDPLDAWGVILCQDPDHPDAVKEMAVGATQAALRAPPLDPNIAFQNLKEALVQAGAIVNPKITRGKAPPLNVPGILATEDIEEGEIIFSIPKHLHVSHLCAEEQTPSFYEDTNVKKLPEQSREEGARYALVTRLLHDAEERAVAAKENREWKPEDDWLAEVDPKIRNIWVTYADQLLSEDFEHHPIRKMGENPEAMRKLLLPSCYSTHLYKEVRRVRTLYREVRKNSQILQGTRFEAGMFLRTMLNFQSRQFKAAVSASLVPGSDLLNHAPADEMCVAWGWYEDIEAHVLKCVRSIKAGQELLQSYGNHANTSFFRCYGFTMRPVKETTWCYSLWKDDVPAVYTQFIPPTSTANKSEVHLTTMEVSQSLRDVLTEIAQAGGNPAFFLRSVCTACLRNFEATEKLKPTIQSLRMSRSDNPCTAAWWEYLTEAEMPLVDDEMVRIQMSDYLCLVMHLEAISLIAGEVDESKCLLSAKLFRHQLKNFLFDLHDTYQSSFK